MAVRLARMKKELEFLQKGPPAGVSCWLKDDSMSDLEAIIFGPPDSPFEKGIFKVDIKLPERYPFEPPQVSFRSKIYHPNIDTAGRICLDILKMPPKGNWKPSLGLSSVLTSIRLLMSEPNPDDPLMADIAQEFQGNYRKFEATAREWTEKYAGQNYTEADPKQEKKHRLD